MQHRANTNRFCVLDYTAQKHQIIFCCEPVVTPSDNNNNTQARTYNREANTAVTTSANKKRDVSVDKYTFSPFNVVVIVGKVAATDDLGGTQGAIAVRVVTDMKGASHPE